MNRHLQNSRQRSSYSVPTTTIKLRKIFRTVGIEWVNFYYRKMKFRKRTPPFRRQVDRVALVSEIAKKNLAFAVTAGRTGTLFIQKLLALVPDTTSLHEPEPAFHRYFSRLRRDPEFAKEFLLEYKLPFIAELPTSNYVELSHVFSKGYIEPLLALGVVPNIIMVRRPPREIALSYLERYTVPARTYYGFEYLLRPDQEGVLPLPGWRRMTDYQLIFWYALEMERRQRAYGEFLGGAGGAVCDITAIEMHNTQDFLRLVDTLGMSGDDFDVAALVERHKAVASEKFNINVDRLQFFGDLDAEEEEVWQRVLAADPTLRSWVETRYVHGHGPSFLKRARRESQLPPRSVLARAGGRP